MRHLRFSPFRLSTPVVLATVGLLSCDHSATGPSLDQLTLDVVSGDGQTAVAGTQLAPLIVKVTSGGNPVSQQVLNFRVASGGGSVYGGTELTDDRGIAQELWTLGTKASELQTVEVRAVESNTGAQKVFATFTATALPGPATLLKLAAGDQQTAGVGTQVGTPPAVLVTDQYGNPVAGIAVAFAVTGGGGSVAGASATTGANGMATVGSWTLGTTAGSNTLTATSAGLTGSPLTFTATATGPAALNITNYAGDAQTALAGATVPVAPAVQVTDQSGHPVAGVTVTFSVTAGRGTITGAMQLTNANGIATVASWTLGPAPGVNELKATFNTGPSRGSTIFVATAIASQRIYVANNSSNSITVYAPGASGNATPTATIIGSNTGLASPVGIALDAAGNVYVANSGNNSITVYAPGANSNAAPTATIAGGATGLALPFGIALGAAGNIYVANCGGNLPPITVYAPGTNGDATPTAATIMGPNAGLSCPTGITFDAAGNIYVANNTGVNAGHIAVFAAGANGDAAPMATITGGNTGLLRPLGIALDAAGNIYATNTGNNTITVFAPGANGNAAPTVKIAGGNTGLAGPNAIAFDAAGNIYVANCGNSITVYAPGANGNATPISTITGSNTGLSCPAGIAF